ncbi:hypothetical protein T484DRAFT_1754219, partial [Baffinella frigidus]
MDLIGNINADFAAMAASAFEGRVPLSTPVRARLANWLSQAQRGWAGAIGKGERDAMAKVLLVLRELSRGWDMPDRAVMGSAFLWKLFADCNQGSAGVFDADFDAMLAFVVDGIIRLIALK